MPFPLVLGCDRPLVGVDTENFEVVQKRSHPLFLLSPRRTRTPKEFPEHHALRQPRVLHARYKPRGRIRLLRSVASMLSLPVFTRVVIGASVLLISDAAGQEAVVGSAQRFSYCRR